MDLIEIQEAIEHKKIDRNGFTITPEKDIRLIKKISDEIINISRIGKGYINLMILKYRGHPNFEQYPINSESENQP